MLFPLLSWTPRSGTLDSTAPEYNDVCCPFAIKSLTPHSMARISMTPNSMAPKPLPEFLEISVNWEVMSLETSPEVIFFETISETSSESTPVETVSAELISTETMPKETISEEAIADETRSSEPYSVEETSSEVASSQVESSKQDGEDTNTSKPISSDTIIRKENTFNSKATLASSSPISSPATPLVAPKAIFKIKSKPTTSIPTEKV